MKRVEFLNELAKHVHQLCMKAYLGNNSTSCKFSIFTRRKFDLSENNEMIINYSTDQPWDYEIIINPQNANPKYRSSASYVLHTHCQLGQRANLFCCNLAVQINSVCIVLLLLLHQLVNLSPTLTSKIRSPLLYLRNTATEQHDLSILIPPLALNPSTTFAITTHVPSQLVSSQVPRVQAQCRAWVGRALEGGEYVGVARLDSYYLWENGPVYNLVFIISGYVSRLLLSWFNTISTVIIRSRYIIVPYTLFIIIFIQKLLRNVTVFGAGLLIGTALIIIIPEGIKSLYDSGNNYKTMTQGRMN